MRALEYRLSNRDLSQGGQQQQGNSSKAKTSCRAIVQWKDQAYRPPVFPPQSRRCIMDEYQPEHCQPNRPDYDDERTVYGPHRLQSFHKYVDVNSVNRSFSPNPFNANLEDCHIGHAPSEMLHSHHDIPKTCFGINFSGTRGRVDLVGDSFKYLEHHLGNLANVFQSVSDRWIGKN